jgi:SAM-dependent methyltransferase
MNKLHEYNANYYRCMASFAVRSAQQIVPLLECLPRIDSVVDFGCGQGAWLSVWRKKGASVLGVDGPYVDQRKLMIDNDEFRTADLSEPIDLGQRFDVVQSLEVAEHLPYSRASEFINTLTSHGPFVMFSAAVPGQGGEHHINEQPLEYWREKFRDRGYVAIDYVRPKAIGNLQVQYWYRYNIILYAEESHLETLPERLQAFRVLKNQRLHDYWPLSDRVRHTVIRCLPRGAVDRLSRLKARLVAKRARSSGFTG